MNKFTRVFIMIFIISLFFLPGVLSQPIDTCYGCITEINTSNFGTEYIEKSTDMQDRDVVESNTSYSKEINVEINDIDNNYDIQNSILYERKYAVIVVGRYAGMLKNAFPKNFQKYYRWYLNAARMMYETFRDTYGYQDENIFLLVSLRDRYDVPDGFDSSWIDYDSNKQNLQNVLNKFKPGGEIWLDSNDSFLFCYIDHGADNSENDGKYASDTYFGFPYEFDNFREIISHFLFKKNLDSYNLCDWELAEYLENIHAGRMIFILQPCYSGGFINELSGINHIVCTSSRENEVATQSWIEPFIGGLGGKADANGDNKISILEAYEYAAREVNKKTTSEHPLIDDNDDGIGHHYAEVGYDPCNPNADGYLAARTYL